MTRSSVDGVVVEFVREVNRPVRFREIADGLVGRGITKSQVHNAVYGLGKRGRLRGTGSGGAMTYVVAED